MDTEACAKYGETQANSGIRVAKLKEGEARSKRDETKN
jgi:hypothetical protein